MYNIYFSLLECNLSLLRTITKRARTLARVCGTGMYRFIEHVKFAKFQTEIFAEW